MDKRGTLDQEDTNMQCMNRDTRSYQLSHTWDQVISRSVLHRAVNSQQDVIKMSVGHRNVVIR